MIRACLALVGLIGFVAAAALGGCTGGCYNVAAPVSTLPDASCLTLFAGQSAVDATVCEDPDLGGQNGCADALTLPPHLAGGAPTVVAAGGRIAYALPHDSVAPGITVVDRGGGARDYVIAATLGAQSLTITISIHGQ